MGELPKQLLAWLARLLPKQKVRGDRAIQVERVDGDLSTDHSTHHHTTRFAQSGCVGTGAMHMGHVSGVQNVTQVHQHFYAALPPQAPVTPDPPAAPAEQAVPEASVALSPAPAARSTTTAAHKEVLSLMDPLPESVRFRVLDFMRREFGTGKVIDLPPHQLHRLRKYVEAIHRCKN